MRRLAPVVAAAAAAAAVLAAWPADERTPTASARPEASQGRAVFAELGCGSCHTFAGAGSTGQMAPNLDERVKHHTVESLRAVILKPPGAPHSMMPDDFGERTTDTELNALVRFLLARD